MRGGISIPFGLTDLFYNDPYEVASDTDIGKWQQQQQHQQQQQRRHMQK
jgi:lysophospholipid acyltransferase (LPLAT)-like uncharacterized protein